MGNRDYFNIAVALTGFCLFFTLDGNNASLNKNCTCRGPTNYYKELGCRPVFKNPDDCCPIRYDCSVLYNLSINQCLVSGHVYESGQTLLDEYRNPCDWSCICMASPVPNYGPRFSCTVPRCTSSSYESPCYLIQTDDCCGDQVICPKKDGSYATCIVDGKTYRDGELFVPAAEPDKRCYCAEGYTGENIAPFCSTAKHTWCYNVLREQRRIRSCAPSYAFGESLQSGCNDDFRCPSSTDVVIKNTNSTSNESNDGIKKTEDPDMLCKFGNLTLRVGEGLNQLTSRCLKCTCEVPPILTCQSTMSRKSCIALNRS